MACDNVIDFLARETGRFGPEIYARNFNRSPWMYLIRKDTFPAGMGETISTLVYERQAPTDAAPTWSSIATTSYDSEPTGVEGGSCLPTATKIGAGSTTYTWSLSRRVLEGPDFCAEDLRTPFQVTSQLDRILNTLSEYSLIEWEIRYRHEYLRLVKRRVVVGITSLVETTNGSWAAFCPGGELTQGALDTYKLKLIRDGAGSSAMLQSKQGPVLTLVCSAETSDRIIKDNTEARQDLRWAQSAGGLNVELLKSVSVDRVYRGFFHNIDHYPIRYTCSGGTFTEVAAFSSSAATKGTKADMSSSWEAAPYEVSFIFDPMVFTSRIPKPVTSPHSRVKFDPVSYMGDFRLKNILDRVCNPDGNIVYHRAILAQASEAVYPERGVAFVHLRCDPSLSIVGSCT